MPKMGNLVNVCVPEFRSSNLNAHRHHSFFRREQRLFWRFKPTEGAFVSTAVSASGSGVTTFLDAVVANRSNVRLLIAFHSSGSIVGRITPVIAQISRSKTESHSRHKVLIVR